MEKYKTDVRKSDIEFLGESEVAIKSSGLINTFVQSPSHGLAKLAEENPAVSIDAISVDSSGRIVISDKRFAEALRARISAERSTPTGDTNYVCKNAYQCKPL